MSYNNVGKVWTPETLEEYLAGIKPPTWLKGVCLHHTYSPSLAQRPKGFTAQHIINMRDFYKGLGWSSGPQLFVDDDQIFGMTPLSEKGVHAPDFNSSFIGIETLGNYDDENPKEGRGLDCWKVAAKTTKLLLDWMKQPVNKETVVFHREGAITKRTNKKSCPGTKVEKDWILGLINGLFVDKIQFENEEHKDKKFTPVAEYMIAKKGYSYNDISKNLLRKGKDYFWGDDHLEFAFYDTKQETTLAPLSELELIKNK